jgi:eukaryotic-like serine/threonine-protein kinase
VKPGARLGPYEIVAPLGAGGMGEVWRARDGRLGRDVAIKLLPAGCLTNPDRLRRFEQEARATAALSHPNILAIYDVGTDDGQPYIVEELLEGETLRERLRGGAMPLGSAVELAVQVAHGLAAAHGKGIVHRDLKPENVFVTADGVVKVLDFGLAKLTQPEPSELAIAEAATAPCNTASGAVLGTVGYMAPEQVRGQAVDHRADIFAFGCVLYEMLSGVSPFRKASAADTVSAILHEEPPPLSSSGAQVAPVMQELVSRCLEKRPADRFSSAHDLALALRAASGGQAVAPAVVRAAGWTRRWPWLLGACVLAVVAILAVQLVRRGQPAGGPGGERIRSIAVLPLANLSGDPEQEYFADGMTEELITDLSKIAALQVTSRTSVMRFKGTTRPIPEIAAALHVQGVVEGSVLRAGDRVRITAQLIDAGTDVHLWAQQCERDLKDVLALQTEVARAIAGEIKVTLTPQERSRLTGARPVDPEAHEEYLKGKFYLNKMTPEGFEKGLEHLRRAVEKDPKDPQAYAALALGYSLIGHERYPDAFTQAKVAARKAEELGGEPLAEMYLAVGIIKLCSDWDFDGAKADFERALALNPSLGEAHQEYSWYLFLNGHRDEALAEMKRAQEVDPLTPQIAADRGWQYWWMGQQDKAIEEARKSLELDPSFNEALHVLGSAFAEKGMFQEAIAAHQKLASVDPDWRWSLPRTLALAGRTDESRKLLARIVKEKPEPTGGWAGWFLAEDYAALGEMDEAFKWLEAAYRERQSFLPWIRDNPAFAPLRADPRFADIERRLGLPAR